MSAPNKKHLEAHLSFCLFVWFVFSPSGSVVCVCAPVGMYCYSVGVAGNASIRSASALSLKALHHSELKPSPA